MDLVSDQVEPTKYSYFNFTKTQFLPIETHVWIVGLLRYLKKHYLSDLEVRDEGDYWETENLKILKEKKDFLQSKINQFGEALEKAEPLPEGLSVDKLIDQIEAIVKKMQSELDD